MADKAANAYRTISEAGKETGLPAHVLRFWESKFSQLRPVKRAGGRRLYRPDDIALIQGLKHLLYEEGFTIKGAQKYVKEHGVSSIQEMAVLGQGPSLRSKSDDRERAAVSSATHAPLLETISTHPDGEVLSAGRVDRLVRQLTAAKAALDSVRKPTPG